MTKNQFIKAVAQKLDWVEEDVRLAIDATFDVLMEALIEGEEYSHKGFGKFSIVTRRERQVNNLTGQGSKTVPQHRAVKFKPGKFLRDGVKNAD